LKNLQAVDIVCLKLKTTVNNHNNGRIRFDAPWSEQSIFWRHNDAIWQLLKL